MNSSFKRLLSFELRGPVAQFRKYYSNISALSYEIPPRTAISGMLASILEMPRDSYYEEFAPEKSKFTIQLLSPVRKYMAYMNYQNPKKGSTIQTRVELLFPFPEEKQIRYKLFFSHKNKDVFNELLKRLKEGNTGFGIYLGQRQFRASILNVEEYKSFKWEKNYEGSIYTTTNSENIASLKNVSESKIVSCSMPVQMERAEKGRRPKLYDQIVYDSSGKGLEGNFKEALQLPEGHIAFMSRNNS